MPTVRDILFAWLVEHGYDGLYKEDECGCNLDALLPCERCCDACQPGYKHPGDEHAEWYIRPEKPEEPPTPPLLKAILATRKSLIEDLRVAVEWLDSDQKPQAILTHLGIHRIERVKNLSVGFAPDAWQGLTVVSFSITHSPMITLTAEDVAALRVIVEEVAEVRSDWNGAGTYSYSIALNRRAGHGVRQCLNNYHAASFKIFDQEWRRAQVWATFPEGWR